MSRVALLQGGRSLEREVSLRSAARVADALERLGHDVVAIDAGHDLVPRLRDAAPDVAFIALHGRDGEDGTVQELLELVGVPYTGSGISACIQSFDKVLSKHRFRDAGIPTPDFFAFTETAFRALGAAQALPEIEHRLAFPIVIKPAGQGSALGIRFAEDAGAVPAALLAAFSYDDKVLLERYVAGRDLGISLLEGEPLPIVEAVPIGKRYDFEARYTVGQTEFVCPARLPREITVRAQELAVRVWDLLGMRGMARVDLLLAEETGELVVLEANAVPGLTDTSLLPQAAEAAGVDYDSLIQRLLDLAG